MLAAIYTICSLAILPYFLYEGIYFFFVPMLDLIFEVDFSFIIGGMFLDVFLDVFPLFLFFSISVDLAFLCIQLGLWRDERMVHSRFVSSVQYIYFKFSPILMFGMIVIIAIPSVIYLLSMTPIDRSKKRVYNPPYMTMLFAYTNTFGTKYSNYFWVSHSNSKLLANFYSSRLLYKETN